MKHCWKDYSEYVAEKHGEWSSEHIAAMVDDGTCMLEDGHEGEHRFTPDSGIVITVVDGGIEVTHADKSNPDA